MRRRTVLAGAGTAILGFSGCLSSGNDRTETNDERRTTTTSGNSSSTGTPESIDPGDLDGYVRPDDDAASVPGGLACDADAFQRRDGWIDGEPHWGDLPGEDDDPVFSLRVNTLAATRGDTVTVTMMNVSGETQQTGNVHKSNLDVYTESGWQDPRGWADGEPKPITDELREWEPGERVELSFEMTAQGIVDAAYPPHQEYLVTCPDLPLGRYRFGTAAPVQGDVAVAFDLRE
jgi:hypothetical protein